MKRLLLFILLFIIMSGVILAQTTPTHKVLANTDFNMMWTPGTNCSNYEVEVSINDGPFEPLMDVVEEMLTTQLLDNQKAQYRVRGFRDETEGRVVGPYSDPSDFILGVIPPQPPHLDIIEIVRNWFTEKT